MKSLLIRSARLEEAEKIRNWRNDDRVIRGALSGKKLSIEDHQNWYEKMVLNNNIYIVEMDGEPLGVVYFERKNQDEFEESTWSFYVVPEKQGQCLGRCVATLGLEAAHFRGVLTVYADVMHENRVSLQLHDELGFIPWAADDKVVKFYKEIY